MQLKLLVLEADRLAGDQSPADLDHLADQFDWRRFEAELELRSVTRAYSHGDSPTGDLVDRRHTIDVDGRMPRIRLKHRHAQPNPRGIDRRQGEVRQRVARME